MDTGLSILSEMIMHSIFYLWRDSDMRFISKHIEKTGEGTIRLVLDQPDDVYTCFDLINVGDDITTSTVRNVSNSQ